MAHASPPWHVLASQTQQVYFTSSTMLETCIVLSLGSCPFHSHPSLSDSSRTWTSSSHLLRNGSIKKSTKSQCSCERIAFKPWTFWVEQGGGSHPWIQCQAAQAGRQWAEMELMGSKRWLVGTQMSLSWTWDAQALHPLSVPIPAVRNENSQEENTFKNTTQLKYHSEFFSKSAALEKRTDILNGLPVHRNKRQGMTLLLILTHLLREEHSWYSDKYSSRDSYLSQLAT